jgi:hypothetical protein
VSHFQCFSTDQEQVRWRFLGGNNRVLGISAHSRPDHATALDDIDAVREFAGEAAFELERMPAGPWRWRMFLQDEPVACSARGFARRVDAILSYQRFQHSVPESTVDPVLAVFPPGRRGRDVLERTDPRPSRD